MVKMLIHSLRRWDMAIDLTRPERLQIMLSAEELSAIDDWRFQKRMPSRASAIRELLNRGLSAEGFAVAGAGRQSSSFGVIAPKGGAEKARNRSNGKRAE
jgi:hypothetical protein